MKNQEEDFTIEVNSLSDGNRYSIKGKIFNHACNKVVFYLPFEPTVADFSTILSIFRNKYSVTDDFSFMTFIQPARYEQEIR